MPKHNNVVPNAHFHKAWQLRVKTWFDQPANKKRRRIKRAEKAAKVFPRPVAGALRPIVRCPTIRYNKKQRLGRGFTLEELKGAGIPRAQAPGIGIAVDHRRKNRSEAAYQENVQLLKKYRANLILFPRKKAHHKSGDAPAEDVAQAVQRKVVQKIRPKPFRAPKAKAVEQEKTNKKLISSFIKSFIFSFLLCCCQSTISTIILNLLLCWFLFLRSTKDICKHITYIRRIHARLKKVTCLL